MSHVVGESRDRPGAPRDLQPSYTLSVHSLGNSFVSSVHSLFSTDPAGDPPPADPSTLSQMSGLATRASTVFSGVFEPAAPAKEDVRRIVRPVKPKLLEMAAQHSSSESNKSLNRQMLASPLMTRAVRAELVVSIETGSETCAGETSPVSLSPSGASPVSSSAANCEGLPNSPNSQLTKTMSLTLPNTLTNTPTNINTLPATPTNINTLTATPTATPLQPSSPATLPATLNNTPFQPGSPATLNNTPLQPGSPATLPATLNNTPLQPSSPATLNNTLNNTPLQPGSPATLPATLNNTPLQPSSPATLPARLPSYEDPKKQVLVSNLSKSQADKELVPVMSQPVPLVTVNNHKISSPTSPTSPCPLPSPSRPPLPPSVPRSTAPEPLSVSVMLSGMVSGVVPVLPPHQSPPPVINVTPPGTLHQGVEPPAADPPARSPPQSEAPPVPGPKPAPQQTEDEDQEEEDLGTTDADSVIYQKVERVPHPHHPDIPFKSRKHSYTIPRQMSNFESGLPGVPVKAGVPSTSSFESGLPGVPVKAGLPSTSSSVPARKSSTTSYVPLSVIADSSSDGTVYERLDRHHDTLSDLPPPRSSNGGTKNPRSSQRYSVTGVHCGPPSWCKCHKCSHSDTGVICCAKVPELHFMFEDNEPCVTNTPIFEQIVTNKAGLKYGDWVGKKWLNDDNVNRNNRAYRHLAYNAFVNLVSSHLRKHWSHKVLPSCVVWGIRQVYPSPDGSYSGIVRST